MRTNIYYDNYMLLEDYDNPYDDPDEEDEEYEVCPNCKGTGYEYYTLSGYKITYEEYKRLGPSQRLCKDKCEDCGGSGVVEVE